MVTSDKWLSLMTLEVGQKHMSKEILFENKPKQKLFRSGETNTVVTRPLSVEEN